MISEFYKDIRQHFKDYDRTPFEVDSSLGYLRDSDGFLGKINNKIDCLLFGHITPAGVFQQPRPTGEDGDFHENNNKIPFINCENLEKMNFIVGNHPPKFHLTYPITVLDLGSYQRLVFQSDGSGFDRSWGNPP